MKLHLVLTLIAALTTGGCTMSGDTAGAAHPDSAHNARNSLDWAGAYRGVLPCADCPGIETLVVLASDGTYSTQSKYLGRGNQVFSGKGRFTWNQAGNAITFSDRESARYFLGENRLTRLALDGSRITGPLAEHYVLTKLTGSVTEKYWKLVELRGQPVPALDREPYLILKAERRRVNGFGGCNAFSGSYTLAEATSRISFGLLVSTARECRSGMEVEKAFYEVLRTADNYSLNGDRLTLNRARMAPLARFEAVHLR